VIIYFCMVFLVKNFLVENVEWRERKFEVNGSWSFYDFTIFSFSFFELK
jgi:hypothetical protein